jgi:uncharacterized protein (TIGR03437 family)
MLCRIALGLLLAVSLQAADFQNGQAARAVIGQPGFSSRETGVSPDAFSIEANRLYAAEPSGHVLTFNLSNIPAPKDDFAALPAGSCHLCGVSPAAVASQQVIPGVAAISSFGRTVVVADAVHHHILIWRDSSEPTAGPDIILGRGDSSGISAATLVNPVSVAFDGRRLFVGDAALHRVLIWNSIPASGDQPADVVLGQPDFSSSDISESPRADTIRLPAALLSDGMNLYVGDSADHRILVFTPGDTMLPENAVVNAATLSGGAVAPGALITVKGTGLTYHSESVQQNPEAKLPLKLAGVEVILNGVAIPLLSVAPDEIQAQVPYGLDAVSSTSLYVRTERSDGSISITNAVAVTVAGSAPGLFAFTGIEPRLGILLHTADNAEAPGGTPVTTESPASPGEVLTIWATGLGAIADSEQLPIEGVPFAGPAAPVTFPVSASVDGRSAQVLSAELPPGAIGIYQVRILLPPDLPADPKAQLFITEHGMTSNTIVLPVQAPKH